MTRRVFAESVYFAESAFAESGAFLPSQLLSQLFADEAHYCWVSFAESDRQFIDVDIDRFAEGPRDAESWFRAQTYYVRILNVLPVFAESVFLMTRRVFAESVFLLSQFCWVRQTVYWCGHWPRRLLRDRVTLSHDSERKHAKRFACFCWVSFCTMTTALVSETPRLYVHAVNHLASHVLKLLTIKPDFLIQELQLISDISRVYRQRYHWALDRLPPLSSVMLKITKRVSALRRDTWH